MTDENPSASGGGRPVEPPIIDLKAEEIEKNSNSAASDRTIGRGARSVARALTAYLKPPVIVAVLVVILLAGGIVATVSRTNHSKTAMEEAVTARLQGLESSSEQTQLRLGELTAAIQELKTEEEGTKASDPALQAAQAEQLEQLAAKIEAVNEAVERVSSSLKVIESGQNEQQNDIKTAMRSIGEMQSRIGARSQSISTGPSATNALATSLVTLKSAIEQGHPFRNELENFRALLPEASGITDLDVYAETGVAKIADLADQMRKTIDETKTASDGEPNQQSSANGIWSAFKVKAAALISVRKLKDAKWLDAAEGAMLRLEENDLDGAVRLLRAEGSEPPQIIGAWLKVAEARLAADKAVAGLSATVLNQLGGA
jgi:hypothetical protein